MSIFDALYTNTSLLINETENLIIFSQSILVALTAVLIAFIFRRITRKLGIVFVKKDDRLLHLIKNYVLALLFLLPFSIASALFDLSHQTTLIAIQLIVAAFACHFLLIQFESKLIFYISVIALFPTVVLYNLELLSPLKDWLDKHSIQIGPYTFTPVGIFKSLTTLVILLWVTSLVSSVLKSQITKLKVKDFTKEILFKASDIFLYASAFAVSLNILGIKLATLTFIGGALSVGIGFGLQKITANFISGLILLFEKSIKIGDLVEINGGTFGYIRKLSARYTLVETFDGKEILIPNEEFIINQVSNWTFSNTGARVELTIGVSYNSDLRQVHDIIINAAKKQPDCLADPEPFCFLQEFADSSVNFGLFFYIADINKGRLKIKSDVFFEIWEQFKKHNIEIPFPQRDIHIKQQPQK